MDRADPSRGRLAVLSSHLGTDAGEAGEAAGLEKSPVSAAAPGPRGGALAVVDGNALIPPRHWCWRGREAAGLERSPVSATTPGPRGGALDMVDGRTGKRHEVKVSEDGTVRATDFKKAPRIDGPGGRAVPYRIPRDYHLRDDKGLKIYGPGYLNTAPVRSSIYYVDGDEGILHYRGHPIEELAESSSFGEVAYLLMFWQKRKEPLLFRLHFKSLLFRWRLLLPL